MDDQAEKLRQLVRTVRHAATVATGPPLILVHGALPLGQRLLQSILDHCVTRGIAVDTQRDTALAATNIDWRLVHVTGDYQTSDHDSWQRASALVLMTYADDESIVECYKLLKRAADHTPIPPIELVMLDDGDRHAATKAAERLGETCRRFLHASVAAITCMPADDYVDTSATAALVDRLAMMAPVAHRNLNSPIASTNS